VKIRLKDIMQIVNCSAATASRMLTIVRIALNKQKPQYITKEEFCRYFGLPT